MSTRRADFRIALAAILDDFRAANPSLIRQTYRARPASFHPPCAYVGVINETISHQFGSQRTRIQTGSLVLIHGLYDNAETADRQDVLADALITYLTDQHARVAGTTLLEATSAEDVELVIKEVPYAATVVVVRHDVVE